MFAISIPPRRLPRALLAILLPLVLLSSSLSAAPEVRKPAHPEMLEKFPLKGAGFSYRIEDDHLVGWADPEFAHVLLGGSMYIRLPEPEGGAASTEATDRPKPTPVYASVLEGVRVVNQKALRDPSAPAPKWMENLTITSEWTRSERDHCLDLTVRVKNESSDLLVLREDPLVIALGPLGFAKRTSQQFTQLSGWIQGDSLMSLAADSPVDEDVRWVSYQNGFVVYVMELVEGPGRFLIENQMLFEDAKGEKKVPGELLLLRPVKEIHGHESFTVKVRLFAGLKDETTLKEGGYPLLFDLWGGWFGWIGKLMFELLRFFYTLTMSWGLAIVLLTVVVKVALHPLNRKQLESMAKMQELQPRMQAIQARYADNQQRQQAEIQKLFAEAGVNPLQGCLPILMQIPIFFALYSCLSNAPELRGVPFLWLTDLSLPDPYLILPALFAAGIFLSSAATATDPSQKAMMQIMPLVMFFFMVNIASGVMIYLAGQTILGIFEQRQNKDLRDKMRKPAAEGEDGQAASETVIDNEDAQARAESQPSSGPKRKYKKGKNK